MDTCLRFLRSASGALGTVGVFTVIGTSPIIAQIQEVRLTAPDARFPEAFSSISGLRELVGGRLLVSDGLGQALVVVDLARGTADTIGRVGPGPAEYRSPDALFPLPGDQTLLVDLGNARLTVLGRDFQFGNTWPLTQDSPGPGGLTIRIPVGTDAQGHVYYQNAPLPRAGAVDSATVLRWNPSTGIVDTVARAKIEERRTSTSGGPNNQNVRMMPVPLSPRDAWAVTWDGRVGIARSGDYHVDWVLPDRRVVRGPPVAYERVALGRPEKEAWMREMGTSGLRVSVEMENGRQRTSLTRGGGRAPDAPNIDEFDWPQYGPPFRGAGARAAPDGSFWVERYLKDGSVPTFDVFDERGRLIRRVLLPAGRRLVGLGSGVAYAVASDEFDLQYLERYRL